MPANFYKLVNGTHAAKNGIILNDHMTRQVRIVAHHAPVTYTAIMRNMTISLNEAIVSDRSLFPFFRSAVYGYKFADGGIISDENIGILALKFQILRNGCNYGTRENPAVFTDTCAFHNGYIGANPCTLAYFHILVDDG